MNRIYILVRLNNIHWRNDTAITERGIIFLCEFLVLYLTHENFASLLETGVLGGSVHEAMTDLVKLMSTLVDSKGKILVDGIMDTVKPVTPEEEALYDAIEFDLESYKEENKVKNVSNKLLHDDKKSLLMARWRYPTLSLHGIEGAFSGVGAKTVIPAKVIGKFSLRLVPDQDPKVIEQHITKHIQNEFDKVRYMWE